MRKKKPALALTESPTPTAPARPLPNYSLELVAGIAVHLSRDHDHATAAKAAIDLLDACRKELARRAWRATATAKARAHVQAKDERVLRGDDRKPRPLPWRELYKYITGETREERAMPKLKKTLEHLGWENIPAKIRELKREGLYSSSALDLRDACERIGAKKKTRQRKNPLDASAGR